MEENYNALMYLTPNDFNQIEDKIEELTNKVREKIYNNQQSSLRNIQVGDDLSGKTLYLSFPKDSYENITNTTTSWLIRLHDSIGIWYRFSTPYKHISIQIPDDTTQSGHKGYFIYSFNINNTYNNPYLNNVRFKLPDDYGVVTEINENDSLYPYIKIYENNDIIPDYITKEWSQNEFPYMQDIDRIEQGIKNLGDYFTKPLGWITTKDWLQTNSITDRSDYGVGSKSFSYQDINRWIHNLNLINEKDMDNITIWNTNKTQYYWDEEE